MPASERMIMITGAESCVEVQGGTDDPTVLLVGSSMLTLTLIASRPNTPGPIDDDLPEHDDALTEVIMSTPEPDWSDKRAAIDHLMLQARTFAGAGAFDEAARVLTPRSPAPPASGARRATSPSQTMARACASGSA